MSNDPDYLLTLPEVASELRISDEQARRLTMAGRLPFVNCGAGKCQALRRVRRADLDAFKRGTITQDVGAAWINATRTRSAEARGPF